MNQHGRKVVIIGGGVAGLCAAVYAQKCGYQTEVLEMHTITGGLATSWQRGGYTFETCLHWLVGSKPGGDFNRVWREVCDIDQLQFVFPTEMARMEDEHGASLPIPTNVDRLEKELLERAPEDAKAIRSLARDIRTFSRFQMPSPGKSWLMNGPAYLRNLPLVPPLRRLTKMSGYEYGKRFTNPLLRSFFGEGEMGQMCALALVFSLAWHTAGDGGYSIGGSQALIHLIEKKLTSLGGQVRCGAKVERILVENDAAVGVQLAGGETIRADRVISAADGHATIYEMLDGRYRNPAIDRNYETMQPFPSYLQVSLGVGMDLSHLPWAVSRILDTPIRIDPETEMKQISFRIFHFDPTFAPPGKTAITSLLMTRNYRYWDDLHRDDPEQYRAEKDRVADAVVSALDRMIPGVRDAVEAADVSTPATVMRYTGNWKGSMEGWFLLPGVSFRPLPNKLPGLRRFMMVGQWIAPGGGLPSGILTARPAIQAICREDHVPFLPVSKEAEKPAHHWRFRTP
jgi:phytoene dehydrogenase-like protein